MLISLFLLGQFSSVLQLFENIKKKKNMASKLFQNSKRRPSIELSPSLERPVFIITKNLNSSHILTLTEELDKNKIAYQMQQETHTLGVNLKQRYFVIVDNQRGEVTLGPEFGSILMNIIGYPRIGRNPKNKYFTRPSQIVAYYEKFRYDRDISERQKTLIRSQYMDVVIEDKGPDSKLGNKIVVRSICKYKSPEKDSSENELGVSIIKDIEKMKLIIVQDKQNQKYRQICNDLSQKMNPKCIIQTIVPQQLRKTKTNFSSQQKIFYLANQCHQKQVLENMTIGELIVFSIKNEVNDLKKIISENKIYGICCDKNEVFKVLQKAGFIFKSNLLEGSHIKEQKSLVKPQNLIDEENNKPLNELKHNPSINEEITRIQTLQSNVFRNTNNFDNNNISNISSISVSKKVKRLKPANNKATLPSKNHNNQESEYYATTKKENIVSSQHNRGVLRKKTTKPDDKMEITKSKKSLKFIDEVTPTNRLRKIKSTMKCSPESVNIISEEMWTMTERQNFKTKNSMYIDVQGSSLKMSCFSGQIHAIFYHQFIPKFHNIVHLIKLNPCGLFANKNTLDYYLPFFNPKEFDRSARKIKQQLRNKQKNIEVFNFLVFMLEEDIQMFENYFYRKNLAYQEQLTDMESTFKATNSSFIGSQGFKINIFAFVEGNSIQEESIDYGKIKFFKRNISNSIIGVDQQISQRLAEKIQTDNIKIRRWGSEQFDCIHC